MEFGQHNIRKSAVAGSFYPGDQSVLKREIENYFSRTGAVVDNKKIRALLVPHAGTVYSGQVAAWGYRQLPKLVSPHFVLIGPSHHVAFDGLAASGAEIWKTPLGAVSHVPPKKLTSQIVISDGVHEDEHDLEVQLPFLQHLFHDFSFTAFATGVAIDIDAVSSYIQKEYPDSVIIISSDLSHYLPDDVARGKDKKTIEAILHGDTEYIMSEDNVACGHVAVTVAMNLAKKNKWASQLVRSDTSATAFGDTSEVVGYASIIWYEQ